MSKKNILHMISPQENVSPFDVNMACDAVRPDSLLKWFGDNGELRCKTNSGVKIGFFILG